VEVSPNRKEVKLLFFGHLAIGKIIRLIECFSNLNQKFMKKNIHGTPGLTLIFFLLLSINSYSQEWDWAKRAGYFAFDYGYGVCADKNGNVYVSGKFEMDAIFDDTMVVVTNNHDIFTAKYDQYGKIQWVRTAGGEWGDYAHAVTCDDNGNVYVTGEIEMDVEFYGSDIKLSSWGDNDIFIAKYNTHGQLLWAKRAGGRGSDRGYSIALSGDHFYLAGSFNDTAYFENVMVVSSGHHDTYLAKYNLEGKLIWVRRGGGPSEDRAFGVTVDPNGDVYMTGFYHNEIEFAGTQYQSNGARDMFLVKYSPNGQFLWFRTAGGLRNDDGAAVVAGKDGRIYVTGGFREQSFFGNIEMWAKKGDLDIFTACYTKDGEIVWVRKAGGDINDKGFAIALDDTLNVYVTGYFGYESEFGSQTITAVDSADIFVMKYDKDGNFKWVMTAGGEKDHSYQMGTEEAGRSLWVDKNGNLIVSGSFRSDATFGSTHLQGWMHSDIFVAKIKQTGSKDFETSLPLLKLEGQVQIFPNPADGFVNLRYSSEEAADVTITIQSLNGQTLYHKKHNSTNVLNESLDLSSFSAGLYLLQITTKDAQMVRQLIIK
jgi:hypothetical protein